jgi:hypothetical protein
MASIMITESTIIVARRIARHLLGLRRR